MMRILILLEDSYSSLTLHMLIKQNKFFNIKEQDIYTGNKLDILWKRCHSRLIEMQSFKYLSKD